MSILPSHTQGSDSFSPSADPSRNPSSEHGSSLSLPPPSSSPLRISFGSLGFSNPQSPASLPVQSPGSMAPVAEDSGGSSKEVIQLGTRRGQETFPHHDTERYVRSWSGSQWAAKSTGKISGATGSPRGRQNTGANNSPRSALHQHSTGRRANTISGNHLLNFHYDPGTRSQPRAPPPPPRRQYKRRPYNKDLFLHANFKFIVLDTGDYSPKSMDPDKMLQWEDIICMRHSTPFPVQCPICLEYPLCPQITSCGHIFCFPCILQYLLMGVENHWTESFKRCPLCFVMVSPKDLYSVHIENVKQYSVGETIEFMLLTRQKGSFATSRKNEGVSGTFPKLSDEIYDPFSKFTFTTDVDLSVRQAMSDLDGWLARADSGLVDDIEKLPYVTAAIGQLKQRKKYWNERRASNNSKSYRRSDNQKQFLLNISDSRADLHASGFVHGTPSSEDINFQNKPLDDSSLNNSDGETSLGKSGDDDQSIEYQDSILSSSCEGTEDFLARQKGFIEMKERDSYTFYQAADGQHVILHSLNMRCLQHHYGSYDMLPPRVSGKILELETVTQSEAMRKRYRYLSHFSLTTTYLLCEIDLSDSLPPDVLAPFMDEIKKRERQRKQRVRKDRKEQIKAEVAAASEFVTMMSAFGQSSRNDSPSFCLDDFEALGNTASVSSSPPNLGDRNSFSNVTRLGFAAGHDSPDLKVEDTNVSHNNEITNSSGGSRNQGIASFANVISRTPAMESMNKSGKRGKKATRVLLSNGGGRRY